MDETHWYVMIERHQRMLEHLQEVEENLEIRSEPIVTVDNQGRHEFATPDEMARYYAGRMHGK